jgi:hypothetical protein
MSDYKNTDEDDLRYHDVDEREWPEVPRVAEPESEPKQFPAFYYLQTGAREMKKVPKVAIPLSLRQGDVLALAVDQIPSDAVEQPANGKKLILALGEATGHHHRFEFMDTSHNVKMFQTNTGARYLNVTAPVDLLHEEHRAATVPVGKYLLPQQVEYTPAELRRVAD